ncbi:MAG: T9SS type A sorting domain-containing protein [Sporocytophaga sp.]|uniref:T9SS type A sorting domain-containing protein n=1 Tax=Sporocytophaga sp. TaxID=2231183 RepID=UPI001B0D6422|nr:T9SS type A sorting domain-containing protein [Sporocytophaga sp.]MBO9699290.1 T9SS type A sorting domain-containing protein [Sporocytophaga sp.]
MKKIYIIFSFLVLLAFDGFSQKLYEQLDTNFVTKEIIIPASPISYDVLMVAQDCTAYDNRINKSGAVREGFGSGGYVSTNTNPLNPETGILILPHRISQNHSMLQDGGGATQMKLQRDNAGHWKVIQQTVSGKKVYFRDVNFQNNTSNVGGIVYSSVANSTEDKKAFFVIEDSSITNNAQLSLSGFSPMDDYPIPATPRIRGLESGKIVERFRNMNWVTKVDPNTAGAVNKCYLFGRAPFHGVVAGDGRVYLTAGYQPSLLFSFESEKDDYSDGTLKVYKQGPTENSIGGWVPLYDSLDINDDGIYSLESLENIMEVALKKGATMFNNLGNLCIANDPVSTNNFLVISETGADYSFDHFSDQSKIYNGQLAHHLKSMDRKDGSEDNIISDPFGRILTIRNYESPRINTMIEGGYGADGKTVFSNPNDLFVGRYEGDLGEGGEPTDYLYIFENVQGVDKGRSGKNGSIDKKINEVYTLSLDNQNPTINSLRRFAVGPAGSIVHGIQAPLSINTCFMAIQYPNPENAAPFNKSVLIAVTGMQESFFEHYSEEDPDPEPDVASVSDPRLNQNLNIFNAWPNPVQRTLNLNKKTDVVLFDANGVVLKKVDNTEIIDMFDVQPGMYFLQNKDKETIKLIVQ